LSVTDRGTEREQGDESISRVVAPSISGNGNFVAFATTAGNMVEGDTNKHQDVFVVNTGSGEVKRLSVTTNGEQANADSPVGQGEKVAISFDGSWVAFSTNAANFGGGVILKNTINGETRIVTIDKGGSVGRPSISRNGGYVLFGSSTRLDSRYSSSGIFANFTATTRCRFCSR